MPSTYSPLKIELPATGEQSGTWGNTTNTNLGTALEEAIVGSADVTFASGNVTLTLTDTNASQTARNLRLNLTGVTGGSTRTLTVPAIEKLYLVSNNCADPITVGNTTGATVTVPAGNNIFIYNDGTDVLNAITYITALNAVSVAAGSVVTTQVDIASQGDLRLQDTTGGQYVALQAPGTIASSYTLTLPVDDGTTGQVLTTDGSGVLSWTTDAGGDVDGPASATDNAVALFDGTTGKIIKNSPVTVGSSGNTIISVTDNTNAALRITQLGTGNALLVEDSANPDSTPFVVNNSGFLISGYTATVSAPTGASQIQSHSTGGNQYSAFRYTDSTAAPEFSLLKSRSITVGTNTVVQNGDTLGNVSFSGADGSNYIRGAQIFCQVDGTPGTSDMPGRLVFSTTADGASSPTERMRIDSAGNVGIGGTPASGRNFAVSSQITGSTTSRALTAIGSIQSDVTSTASYFATSVSTQDSAFTLTNLVHYQSIQGTISGGSRLGVTNQIGYEAGSSLTGATNNYGFYSNIASGTGRWNFYANGTADNYFAGNVGIGTSSPDTLLHLESSSNSIIRLTDSDGSTESGSLAGKIEFENFDAESGGVNAYIAGINLTAQGDIGLTFATGSGGTATERMRIDSAGNVGIGTTSPLTPLHVNGTNGELIRISITSDAGTQQEPALGFATGTTNTHPAAKISALEFDTSDSRASLLFYTRGDNLDSAPTERMRITVAGYTQFGADGTTSTLSITPTVTSRPSITAPMIQTTGGGGSDVYANAGQLIISGRPTDTSTFGNIYIQTGATQQNQWIFNNGAAFVLPGGTATATGTGITFPATQSASTDANTLDDYEEGTWTPTITASVSNPTASYQLQVGYYTKIGRQVFVQGILILTAYSGGSGDVRISSLPFTAADVNQNYAIGSIGQMSNFTSALGDTDGQIIAVRANQNASYLSFYESNETSGIDWTVSALSATFTVRFSISYFTA
jgi:hypothetical protein